MRMTVLSRGLIFLACTYDNDAIITLQKKIDIIGFSSKFTHKKVDSTS